MAYHRLATGAFLIGGLVLFGIGLFLIGDRHKMFSKKFDIYTEFTQLNGLQRGAKVRVSGMEAGEVLETDVPERPDSRFRVKLRIDQKLRTLVRTDSVAMIKTVGLGGTTFVDIQKGTGRAAESPDGSTIASREPLDMAELMKLGSDLMITARTSIDELRGNAGRTLQSINAAAGHTDQLIVSMSADLKGIAATGRRTVNDVSEMTAQARQGRGPAGKLLVDEKVASQIDDMIGNARQSSINLNEASAKLSRTVSDFDSRGLPARAEAAVENTRKITEQLNQATADFLAGGPTGENAASHLREAAGSARHAMTNLADDTEALKRNFFLRGFFRRRGFYNLHELTLPQYRTTKFYKGESTQRAWLSGQELFFTRPDGTEDLSKDGQERIGRAMDAFVPNLANSPIMVEGYSAQGAPAEQFVRANRRASIVRRYLEERFGLSPKTIGVMPMSASPPPGTGKTVWDGISLVLLQQ
jgi:phospholipid/cholesterol/gamma-HCH transport system substrate-binding protein